MINILVLFGLVAAVTCNDILTGAEAGRKIYDNKLQASPTLWRQRLNVTVNVSDDEVITRVVVTDLRPLKDGEARIVEGGEGEKNVTIELQSPAVFRGYEFHVEVYAEQYNDSQPGPVIISTEAIPANKDVNSKPVQDSSVVPPALIGDQTRINRQTEHSHKDPIMLYVDQNKTEVSTESNRVSDSVSTIDAKVSKVSDLTTEKMSSTYSTMKFSDATTNSVSSEKPRTSPKTHENLQSFDTISKELGQKVVFGIRRE